MSTQGFSFHIPQVANEKQKVLLTWGISGLNELTSEKSLETGFRMCNFPWCKAMGTKEVIYAAGLFIEETDLCIKDTELQCTMSSTALCENYRNTLQTENSFPAFRRPELCKS